MGATAQGIMWTEEFCGALADASRHVIRYDNRDTGQTTCFDFAKDPYTLSDLAPYDEKAARELFEREHDRARNYDAMNNHTLAIAQSGDRREALRSLKIPTLVIHGTEDPILPYEHGVATADAIPGAELLTIEGMGHDMPEPAVHTQSHQCRRCPPSPTP